MSVWTGRAVQAGCNDLEIIGLAHLYSAHCRERFLLPGHHGYPRSAWCSTAREGYLKAVAAVPDFPPAVPIDRFSAPQRTGEPQTFEQASDTFFKRHTRCGELLADIRHIGSDADAEYEATFCDLIESRHLVCQQDWIA
jgi:hypothetical protein